MPNRYAVTMQDATGAIVEKEYAVQWNPAKVTPEFVAVSCAAENTVKSGKNQDGSYKRQFAGIAATLIVPIAA
jgi:hypothetical protein